MRNHMIHRIGIQVLGDSSAAYTQTCRSYEVVEELAPDQVDVR